ncbi:MAG: MFS transporter [Holophaga sp.]|nr:MFS transporter [Holophaga sp.]
MLQRCHAYFDAYPRQFWMIACGVLVSSTGSSLVWPFQFIYISRTLGMSLSTVATLITISSATGLLVSFLAGAIADRLGRKPVMFVAQAAQALAWLLMSQAGSYLGFLVPLTILAAAQPLYSVGSDAMMADMIPPGQRASGYSILRTFNNAGIALGPAVGGFIVSRSYVAGFHGAALVMLAYSVFLLFWVRETRPLARVAAGPMVGGYREVFRDRGYIVFSLIVTLGMIAPLMMWTLLAVYTKQNFQFPEHLYSWLPITNALMCVSVQVLVTRFTRRHKPLPMLTLGMLVYALGVGSVALMSSFWGFWVSMVIFSFGELIVAPTGTAYVANRAPIAFRGRYMSIYWMTWGLARAVAPVVGGFLNDRISPHAVWYGGLAIGLASTLGLFILAGSKARAAAAAPSLP